MEGAVFHPEGTLALDDLEWIIIYDVLTLRAEQVAKRIIAWVFEISYAFEEVKAGSFPIEVKPFLERPTNDLLEIKT